MTGPRASLAQHTHMGKGAEKCEGKGHREIGKNMLWPRGCLPATNIHSASPKMSSKLNVFKSNKRSYVLKENSVP